MDEKQGPDEKRRPDDPHQADPGFPEPPGKDPGDISRDRDPHHVLNNPGRDPDPPDPDGEPFGEAPHPPTGATSTSEPHPSEDPEAGDRWEGPKRDKLD